MRRGFGVIAAVSALSLLSFAPAQARPVGPADSSPVAPAMSASATGPLTVAAWEMTELDNASLMRDSSGFGHDGVVGDDAYAEGLRRNGTYYEWLYRCPACPPAAPSRVIQVPDSQLLDIPDPSVRWTAEIRFWTPKGFGNIMQKGQAKSPGGQFKFEQPAGHPRCVWVGANGKYFDLRTTVLTNNRAWHVAQCVHNETSIEMWIDGVRVARRFVRTGPVDNAKPFVVGGKSRCDNIKVTCDYYTGRVDYIRITRG